MIGLNGKGIPGAYSRNPNAQLPNSAYSYDEIKAIQAQLTVPQTAPSNMTPGGLGYSVKIINGVPTYVVSNPHGEWRDSEIFAPPDEVLAKQDIERQKELERRMISELPPERKELLKRLENGELMPKPNLIEESRK